MIMYFESDYDKNLREQRVNNVVKDYGILVRHKVSDVSVSWCNTNKAFVAQVARSKEGSEHLGYFKTELEAFNAYKQAKESFIKEQANKWKSQIDKRAYEALMKYEVNIDD